VEASTILDVVILVAVTVGGVVLAFFRSGVEQAVKEQVTETFSRINWQAVLGRELERIRGTERQELRFASYGKLWSEMRPLAIYDDSPINRGTMKELSKKLSDWYFSGTGGLMLTRHNRDLYFALQDLVSAVAIGDDWDAERSAEPKARFEDLLRGRELGAALELMNHLEEVETRDWPSDELEKMAAEWRNDIREVARGWAELDRHERFAALQQVSSVLRTGLTNDVESRLR
jgi:hypothetical protein